MILKYATATRMKIGERSSGSHEIAEWGSGVQDQDSVHTDCASFCVAVLIERLSLEARTNFMMRLGLSKLHCLQLKQNGGFCLSQGSATNGGLLQGAVWSYSGSFPASPMRTLMAACLSIARLISCLPDGLSLQCRSVPLARSSFRAWWGTESDEEKKIRLNRLEAVKESFVHSWQGYKKYAYGFDDIPHILPSDLTGAKCVGSASPTRTVHAAPSPARGGTPSDCRDILNTTGISPRLIWQLMFPVKPLLYGPTKICLGSFLSSKEVQTRRDPS